MVSLNTPDSPTPKAPAPAKPMIPSSQPMIPGAGIQPSTGTPATPTPDYSYLSALLPNPTNLSADALGAYNVGLEGVNAQQLAGTQNLDLSHQVQQNALNQQQFGTGQQQAALNYQQLLDPQYDALQNNAIGREYAGNDILNARLGIQGAGIIDQGNAIRQQLAGDTRAFYGQEATSGALGTTGQKMGYRDMNDTAQRQLRDIERQEENRRLSLTSSALTRQGIGDQATSNNLSRQARSFAEKQQQQGIDNLVSQTGFNKSVMDQRFNNALSQLGLSGQVSADQLYQAYQNQLDGIPNALSAYLPYIFDAAGLPMPNSPMAGLGGTNPPLTTGRTQ